MRTKLLTAAIAMAAHFALAIHGNYAIGLGPGNTASNSNYAATFGAFAGCDAASLTQTALFGALAGMDASAVKGSVGVGAGALGSAQNCFNCIAIGNKAGVGWRNANGWVQIGDAFVFTNNYLNIGNGLITARKTEQSSDISSMNIYGVNFLKVYQGYGTYASVIDANIVKAGWNGCIELSESGIKAPSVFCSHATVNNGYVTFLNYEDDDVYAVYELTLRPEQYRLYSEPVASIGRSEVCTIGEADSCGVLRFENGGLAVYTNGVIAGTLTFTPAQ